MSVEDVLDETGHSNNERAAWAEEALAAYLSGKKDEEDIEANLTDLVADLLHLAAANKVDAALVLRRAWDHYAYEKRLEAT